MYKTKTLYFVNINVLIECECCLFKKESSFAKVPNLSRINWIGLSCRKTAKLQGGGAKFDQGLGYDTLRQLQTTRLFN